MAKKKPATKKKAVVKKKKTVVKKAKTSKTAAALAADRARVSKQGHELAFVAKKFGVDEKVVSKAIAKVGNMRVDVYAALKSFKARSKAADRALVSKQPHEIALLAKKFSADPATVLAVVTEHGPSRTKVEAALAGK